MKKMKESLKEILNAVSDAITVHDTNFKIIYSNRAAKELLGIASDDVFKKAKCFELFHGLNQPPENCPSCACFNTGIESAFEINEPHLNKYLEIRAIPQFDSENRVTHVVHMVRDITEKKKAELERKIIMEALHESEARYRVIFEKAGDAIFILEAEGEDAGRIAAANSAEMNKGTGKTVTFGDTCAQFYWRISQSHPCRSG